MSAATVLIAAADMFFVPERRKTMKKVSVRISALLLTVLMLVTTFSSTSFAYDDQNGTQSYNSITLSDALYVNGEKLYNRRGEEIRLRGLNLGGWLIMEDWFCPISNDKKGDHYTMSILENRFGAEKTRELYEIYQDNWITETDFQNIADMGFNCVRIPFWYRNFQSDDNGTWVRDENGEIDLSRLEWAVDMCRKYGIYAILDLHGANGCQGYTDHCGRGNDNGKSYHFFDQNNTGKRYRQQAAELWSVIAERFAGDPAVAMFDLLNEPMCDVPFIKRIHSYIWEFYDMAYDAIRAKDPARIITMIGTWSIDKLPNPKSYNWKGVVYQYHQYDDAQSDYTNRIKFGWRMGYNVPQYAGEFHPVGDKVSLDFAINAYDSNNLSWTLWTYKGYNSWAKWSDWFVYGASSADLTVNAQTDSYETIAQKWGEAMQTNSGNFSRARLYGVAKKYLPSANLEEAPYNTQENVENAVFDEIVYNGDYHGNIGYDTGNTLNKIRSFLLRVIDIFKMILSKPDVINK